MRQYPNIIQTIGLFALFLLLQAVFFLPIFLIDMATKSNLLNNPLSLAAVNLFSISLLLWYGLTRSGASFAEIFPLPPVRPILLLPMSLTIIGMSIILSEVNNFVVTVLPIPPQIAEIFQTLFGTRENFWGALLTAVVVAPLTEELFFRGLILRGFLNNYSVRKSVVVSALLFGIFHVLPWQITGAAVLGVVFAWWFVKTRSLIPCLFGHALNNALPIILLAYPQLKIPGYSNEVAEPIEFQPLWFDALGLLLAGTGIWWLYREFAKMDAARSRELSVVSSTEPIFSDNGRMANPQ